MAYRSLPTSHPRIGLFQYRVGGELRFGTSLATLRIRGDYSRLAARPHCGIVAVAPSQ
jgi:hypothetical protein